MIRVLVGRPVTAVVMSLVIVVMGLVSLPRLGIQETPNLERPIVTVNTSYPGAAPAVVEADVTESLERELNSIEGLRTITSESRDATSSIRLEFELGRDLEEAVNDVRDKVARAQRSLPLDVEPPTVTKADGDTDSVIVMRLVGERSLLELSELADRLVRERFERILGVSAVDIYGERRYAMRIQLDADALAARELTLSDVQVALAAVNVEAPAGRVEGAITDISLRMPEGLTDEASFRRVVVGGSPGRPILLGDVATVRLGAEDERSAARADGVPSISVAVQPRVGANVVEISDAVRAMLPDVQRDLPSDVSLEPSYDRSIPVRASLKDVATTLAISATVVVLVIFAFLGSVRATVIPTVAIGVSLIGTLAVQYALGFTLNVFTLFGLVLAIGLVVDDAIVVLENVWRHMELGESPLEAAMKGTDEIVFPVIATTLSLIAVFLPVVFAGGPTGRLFYEFGATLAVAVCFSTVVALVTIPALCPLLLRVRGSVEDVEQEERGWLASAARHPYLGMSLVLCTLVVGGLAYAWIPRDFFPLEDRNFINVSLTGPEGVSFSWMDARVSELEPMVMEAVPERMSVLSRVASGRGGTAGVSNTARFSVPLQPSSERDRSQHEIVVALRKQLSEVVALRAVASERPLIGGGGSRPLEFVLQHDDQAALQAELDRFVDAASALPGLQDVDVNLKLNRPEILVRADAARAADAGVSLAEIARTLQVMSTGLELDSFRRDSRQYAVIVGLAGGKRDSTEELARLRVRSENGALVPVSSLVRFEEVAAASSRYHVDRAPSATVSAALDGLSLGEAIVEMRGLVETELSPGFRSTLAGSSKDFLESSDTLGMLFGLALVLVYLVLAAQFNSFRDPLPILVSLPAGVGAGVGALALVGESLSFFGQIGLILLIGLVTKNGILIVEMANQALAEGRTPMQAAARAARLRLRPVLMTTVSTIGGALPIALGFSGSTRAALGWVVVAGMVASTMLSLLVTPALWAWLQPRRAKMNAKVLVGLGFAALAVAPARAQQPLTFADVMRAVQEAPATLAAEAEAEAAGTGRGVARAALAPSLSASGRAQYGNTFVAGGSGVGGTPFSLMSGSASLRVPFITPDLWAAVHAAGASAELGEVQAEVRRLAAVADAADAFLRVQDAVWREGVVSASVLRAEQLLVRAEAQAEVGRALRLDVVRAAVQLQQERLRVAEVARVRAVAEASLQGSVAVGALDAYAAPEVEELALGAPVGEGDQRPDIRVAKALVRSFEADRVATGWTLAPTLALTAEAGAVYRFDGPASPTTSVGATASARGLDPVVLARMRQAKHRRVAAAARLEATVAFARSEIAQADAELAASRLALDVAASALTLAEEEVSLSTGRFEAGVADNAAVLQAQQRWVDVALSVSDARLRFHRAQVAACVSRGVIPELVEP